MQTKAEEKRKGYCCVVWVERAIGREDLACIEKLSRDGSAVDETGEACIEVWPYTHICIKYIVYKAYYCAIHTYIVYYILRNTCRRHAVLMYIIYYMSSYCACAILTQLSQKTPLRVLHRRSLLDRSRFVYKIETTLLNNHFFLMRLVTSAGNLRTYSIAIFYSFVVCSYVFIYLWNILHIR